LPPLGFLALSLLLLGVGPLLHWGLRHSHRSLERLENVLLWGVTAIVIFYILPESVEHSGWLCLTAAVVGWRLPTFLERRFHDISDQVHTIPLIVTMVCLLVHGMLDGGALANPGGSSHALPWAVIIHRIPDSLLIWLLLSRHHNWRLPTAALIVAGIATCIGFSLGTEFSHEIHEHELVGWLQALVAGSLLHLAGHRH